MTALVAKHRRPDAMELFSLTFVQAEITKIRKEEQRLE
jgi:hypothetical protein